MKDFKLIGLGVAGLAVVFAAFSTLGINDSGERTVVQLPNGHMSVKFTAGPYLKLFGKATVYPDAIDHDFFDASTADSDVKGWKIRYQDGGTGTVNGKVVVKLPADPVNMLKLHNEARSTEGIRERFIDPSVKEALELTAGLMTSEEAYAERRSDYTWWAKSQLQHGTYQTEQKTKEIIAQDGTKQNKRVSVQLVDDNGEFIHNPSVFNSFGLSLSLFKVSYWDFEQRTRDQIDEKRKAEMAAITAEANARKATATQRQIAAEGKAAVEKIKYEQLKVSEEATIKAEREKDVALIEAAKIKEVNQEQLEAAKIDVLTAKEQATAQKTRADAEAYEKKALIEADGGLKLKVDAFVKSQAMWSDALAKRNVPTVVMNSGGEGEATGNNEVKDLMNLMMVNNAKELALNMEVKE